jgi:hypothetical protein
MLVADRGEDRQWDCDQVLGELRGAARGNIELRRMLILGGGFAGLTVAIQLEKKFARNPAVEVTLINRGATTFSSFRQRV